MSELSNKLRALRGSLSQQEFSVRTGIGHRTIVKAEGGERVKLATLLRIAKAVKLAEGETVDLIQSWMRIQLGDYADRFAITPKTKAQINEQGNSTAKRILRKITNLPPRTQAELLKALDRPEVLDSLAVFNTASDRLRQK